MFKAKPSLPNRRDFLRLSSGALVVAAFGSVSELRAAQAGGTVIASLGYWPGVSKTNPRFESAAQAYLVPAQSIHSGDPAFFSSGARAAVRGLWRPEGVRTAPAAYAVDVMYDVEGRKVPFFAWSFAHAAAVRAPEFRSSNVKFGVPIDALGTVDMVIARGAERETVKFSVNSGKDTLKLRPGFYFLAFPESGQERSIDWTRIRIREGAAPDHFDVQGPGVLTASGLLGEEPVPFSYLVLEVEVVPAE